MFNRKLLKSRAKGVLKTAYWRIFASTLLVMLLSSLVGGIFGLKINTAASITLGSPLRTAIFAAMLIFRFGLSLALSVFLLQPMLLGVKKLTLDASEGNFADIGSIGFAFRSNYKDLAVTLLMKELILLAFMLVPMLLIFGSAALYYSELFPVLIQRHMPVCIFAAYILLIPAIIKMYDFYLVEYILAGNPDISRRKALVRSKKLMKGNRFKVFVMNLSFIGWLLLGVCACGIGTVFVMPYIEATNAQLYLELSGRSVISD